MDREAIFKPQVDVIAFVEDQTEGTGRLVNAVSGRRFAADLDLPCLQSQDPTARWRLSRDVA
jgi:hypothetical protein